MTACSAKQRLLAWGRRSMPGSIGKGWEGTIRCAIQELESLNRSTERDFLAVGEKLMEFRSAARQIASAMAALAELISGQQGRNVSHALTRMLEHSRGIDARIQQSSQSLGEVRDLSRRVRQDFSGLPHTVSIFRTLCTLTRIETARLGGTGADLSHLTAEVGPLSESIQRSGEGVLEASYGLDHDVQSAIVSGADLQATQLRELPALISSVLDGLKSFEERRKCAVESSDRQASQYAAVCAAMDDLVGSIQFHDITRQQIEHVIEALERLYSKSDRTGGKPDSPGADARMVLTLQCTHLSESARVFAGSIHRMERDLDAIAARIESAPEASRTLLGISGDDRGSFFLKMEDQFSAILAMLGTCTAAQAEMESTGSRLEETVRHMRDSIAEIRGIEIRIQRISTNASVRATHLGASGVALNVIAEVMQRLALDSNNKTENVAGTLDAMSEAVNRVSGHSGDGPSAPTGQVLEEMRRTVGELHSSSESSVSRMNEIVALGARLAAEIGAVRGGSSAGKMFDEAVHRVRADLEKLAAQVPSGESAGNPAQALEDYAHNYTMQRERDVHHAVTTGSAIPAAAMEASKTTEDGDLGGNVELF
jgi:hypothetical protein